MVLCAGVYYVEWEMTTLALVAGGVAQWRLWASLERPFAANNRHDRDSSCPVWDNSENKLEYNGARGCSFIIRNFHLSCPQ